MAALGTTNHLMDVLARRGERLCYLASRWRDERGYEDFADYRTEVERILSATPYRLISLSRSFAGVVLCDRASGAMLKFKINAGSISVSR